jgi:hypothetical protein|tara:strand:+ start:817 stop:1164 length:348 start_codon:yes stop_codon:yes gene_type:complete
MRISREVKKTINTELNEMKTFSLADMEDTESFTPEERFDNNVINDFVESLLTDLTHKTSARFSKYDHGKIYRMKMDGYSHNEIGRMYNVTGSFISTMIHWIEKRLRVMVTSSSVI